ncbi:ShlB/FhaC/HecB family hemolysin secretion/activation protein, partial [Burkholderia pseudomallei]|nr:ShlB/FhaC/HecB family hemolysin secretion/activation protein [Burkholderia pseudomallei]
MKTTRRLAVLPITTLFTLAAQAQQAPSPSDQAAAARANAEQNQQAQQRRDALQRDATVQAPGVRSDVPRPEAYPVLPTETPCFQIDRFALDVP